jgi:hypothetical protein
MKEKCIRNLGKRFVVVARIIREIVKVKIVVKHVKIG